MRLLGFRASHGVDQNMVPYSMTNLFSPGLNGSYCSVISPNCNVTGVLLKEDPRVIEELLIECNKFFTKSSLK